MPKVKKAVREALKVELKAKKREAKAAGDPVAVERAELALDALRSRKCTRPALFGVPACEKTFIPPLRGAGMINQQCSAACALLSWAKRVQDTTGVRMALDVGRLFGASTNGEEALSGNPRPKRTPPPRRVPDPAALAALEAKWGPLREITSVVEAKTRSKKVMLGCGHSKTVALSAKNSRCDRCKPGFVEATPGTKKKTKRSRKETPPRPVKEARGKGLGDEALTKKYGPMQLIKRVVSTTAGAKRVILDCGHEKTLAAKAQRGRCERCRDGKPTAPARTSKVKKGG